MKYRNKILLLPLLLIFVFTSANAKWWIFGQNESGVDISYLYVNNLSFDSTNTEVSFSKDYLENGFLHIRGKAIAGASNIGKVLVSVDGKKIWQKAKLSSDGAFDFTFEPELGKKYDVYVQILDTTGKSNDMEGTHKIITVIDKNMREIVMGVLEYLKTAYENEDVSSFMRYVSEDFTGDNTTLELALRKDFSAFDNIYIDFSLISIAYNNGQYFVGISFNRNLESSKDGKVYSDSGITQFKFIDGKNGAMLYSMKNPLIFGLSDAGDVADGSVVATGNEKIIIVNSRGDVVESSISEIISGVADDPAAGGIVETGTFTLNYDDLPTGDNQHKGFLFADGSTVDIFGYNTGLSDIYLEINIFFPDSGAQIQELGVDGTGSVDFNHMTVPVAGYDNGPVKAVENDDMVYAVKLPNNTYALMKNISSSITDGPDGIHSTVNCIYKYRADGGLGF